MSKIAVIVPARGGSKGIIGKNLKLLNDKPLVDYTIEFAKKLNLPIFLSSDDPNILERADKNQISQILRPSKFATDDSRIIDTLIHASEYINKSKNLYDSLLVLQPTYLIRDVDEIKKAINHFNKSKMHSLVSLTKMRENPCECIDLDTKSQKWSYLIEPPAGATNRQEFKDSYYFISGNFYLSTISSLLKYKSFMHDQTNFFISRDKYFVDIDDYDDLDFAKSQLYRLD